MPDKLEQAIVRGRGVLPLSAAELARAHPDLWATGNEVDLWRRRKGSQFPIEYSYWKVTTLSAATLMSYRRPGQRRGSPHQAIIPGGVYCPNAATLDLEPLLGVLEDVRLAETLPRPADCPVPLVAVSVGPADQTPEPAAWRGSKAPLGFPSVPNRSRNQPTPDRGYLGQHHNAHGLQVSAGKAVVTISALQHG